MRITSRISAGILATGLAFSLAACSSDSSDDSSSSGSLVKAAVSIPDLSAKASGEMTQVTIDAGFLGALKTLGLTPGVIGKAKLDGAVLTFPITGGNVNVFDATKVQPYVTGVIFHDDSGLSLSAYDSTKVDLTNFEVDPGASKLYGDVAVDGKPFASHVYLFFLDGRTLKPAQTVGSSAVLEGTKVKVSKVAAGALNMVFKTTAVKENFLVGVAKITVNP